MTTRNPPRNLAARRGAIAAGPQAAFVAAVLVACAPLAMSWRFLSPDLALPLTSTLLFVLAALIALVGWNRGPASRDGITYRDVAGALTFIAIFAATLMDQDQVVRIVANQREE